MAASRSELYAAPERLLDPREHATFEAGIGRRRAREPLAYIIGEWGFRRLNLRITPAVLVPRPETELLVERCLEHLRCHADPCVLDIGTGSGAIALAIADEHRGARVSAVDVSQPALELARENATRIGLESRVSFHHGDLSAGQRGPFDLVVSNPPYVAPERHACLEPEVARFEPRLALVGGDFHLRIARETWDALAPGGWLVMESGEEEAADVAGQLGLLGWLDVDVIEDLSARPRIVEGRRPAA